MNTIGKRFRAQAARTPDAAALIFNDERVSYAGLEARADAVAGALRARGIGPGDLVAVGMRHSPDLVAGLLGIASLGAACVGIDRGWPPARVRDALHDSRPALLLADDDTADATPFEGTSVLVPRDVSRGGGSAGDASETTSAGSLFSIVYTSGTTGKPKGVLVTVRSVMNRLEWMWNTYPFRAGDVAFLYRPYTTVGFSWDCFGPLLQGVPVIVSPVADVREAIAIVRAASDGGVTHFSASAGLWEAILELVERQRVPWPSLRLARTSGEPLRPAVVERWRRVFPHATLVNIYGATECSGSTAYDTSAFDPANASRVPVGTPVPGVEVFVVDAALSPVGAGEEGEICVAGASLALGYLGDRALTDERFVALREESRVETRMFRTGDLGVLRPDGLLEITGRRDLQVKVRGYRVEIEEVEAALARCPGVQAAAVHARREGGSARLVGFVVPAVPPPAASELREALAGALPSYMIPADFVAVPELPRTSGGKIDRQALDGLTGCELGAATTYAAPRTVSEVAVAAVWSTVLGMREVSVEDDFFEVGGHSLLGVQIVSRLQQAFGIDLPLRALFDHPSVRELAAEIDRLMPDGGAAVHAGGSAAIVRG